MNGRIMRIGSGRGQAGLWIKGLAVLAIVLMSAVAATRGPGVFEIGFFTVDGGGGVSSGGSFALIGAIGQADAGPTLSGGDFTLDGGIGGAAMTPSENAASEWEAYE